MRISRRYLLPLGVALAAALMVVLYSLNALTGANREFVRQELQKLLAEDATFGELRVSLWGGLGFSAKQFRIADNPRFAANPLLQAQELRLGISFMQLLLGRIVVNSLTFYEPELQIITDEEGQLNLAARKKEMAAFSDIRAVTAGKKSPSVAFRVARVQIKRGRVDFIDRSVREPAEVQVKNVDVDIKGLALSGRTGIRLAAAITEGLGHDMRIDGKLGPFVNGRAWSQQPVELEMQFDSLQIPMITRAMPFFRNKIPRELDVTGPLSLQARVSGTLQRPRITEFRLKAPLFGASDYNATLTGTADLAENKSWTEAQLKGELLLDPIDLTSARNVSFLKEALPSRLVTSGPISIHSRFEGSWQNLRVGALVRADKSDIQYGGWLRKPAGSTANARGTFSRQKNGLLLHDGILTVGASKLTVSGAFEDMPEKRWQLKLHTDRSRVVALGHLFSSWLYPKGGNFAGDILIQRHFAAVDGGWELHGNLKLTEAQFRHKQTGRNVESVNLDLLLLGKQARVERASFRVGSSSVALTGGAVITNEPILRYELRSPALDPADLTDAFKKIPVRLKSVTANGQVQIQDGAPTLQGSIASLEGSVRQVPYRDLHADVAWSPMGITVKNLSAQALNGRLTSGGYWVTGDEHRVFELSSRIESVDARQFLGQLLPQLQQRLDGELNVKGLFKATSELGIAFEETLEGSGETEIHRGLVRDFNLVAQLLSRTGGSAEAAKSRPPENLAALVNRDHTPFDTLRATFTLQHQRVRTDDLLIVTPDYTINAAGWIAFDKTTKWNGLLVLAPHITQELQRAYGSIYFLVDRRGQLALPFRVEGTMTNIKARLDNRALVQNFRRGSPQMPEEPQADGAKRQEKKSRQEWLPESLKQLLNR
ncbi:MAG TPA: AsmA-like C-terminal region-containing protein [Candidatus Binatia bacterium]|nr:AsmA-like C-terminal region-containing protein [Candidatus Binatia bacterium]